jgi:hypothetical protein
MVGMPEGIRKLLVAYDVASYGGREKRQQLAIQQRLVDVLRYALGKAGVSAYELQEQGDGGLGLLPTGEGIDEPQVIADLVEALETGLCEVNEDLVTAVRIRLRLGLDEGIVHRAAHGFVGPAVTGVCRLRDAAVVREMLANSDADLIVVVADHLYRDSLEHRRSRKPAFAQASVTAKEFSAMAWIYLPEGIRTRPAPPSIPASAPPTAFAPHAENSPEQAAQAPSLKKALDVDPRLW